MPLDPNVVFSEGAGVLGAGINWLAQSDANKKAREFQIQMYERQRSDALEDWNRQNLYNSPQAQMDRLKSAGLNPALVYGNGAVANNASGVRPSSAGSYNPKAPSVDLQSIVTSGLQAKMMSTQVGNLEKQKAVMDEEIKNKAADTLKKLTEVDKNKLGAATMEYDLMMKNLLQQYNLEYANLKNQSLGANIQSTLANTQFTLDENERKSVMQAYSIQNAIEDILVKRVGRDKARIEMDNLKKSGQIMDFEIKLNALGFTKSDEWYYRAIGAFITDPQKAIDTIGKFLGGKGIRLFGADTTTPPALERIKMRKMGFHYDATHDNWVNSETGEVLERGAAVPNK